MTDQPTRTRAAAIKSGVISALAAFVAIASNIAVFLVYEVELPSDLSNTYLTLGLLVLGGFIVVLIHELGHAAAARIGGWRIIVIAVRPFALHLPSRRICLDSKNVLLRARGFVFAIPAQHDALTVKRWMATIAGGPLASLVSGLIFAIAAFSLTPAYLMPQPVNLFAILCTALALQSFGGAIAALLPVTRTDTASDGALLLNARKDLYGIGSKDAWPWLQSALNQRVRPRDIPDWMVSQVRAGLQSFAAMPAWCASFEVAQLLDAKRPDPVLIRQKLEAYRAAYGASEWLCACDAYVAAMYEADIPRAEQALAIPQPPFHIAELMSAARAALSARLGEDASTKQHLSEMVGHLREKSPLEHPTYTDIRRNVETLLRSTLSSRKHSAVQP